jgi:preprotein translocase subunit SecG
MEIIRTILLALEVIVCLLLIGIILIQRSKGGGLGAAFGGGGGEQLFGSRTGNVLTKGTIILSVTFFVNTVVLAMMSSNRANESSLLEQALQNQAAQAPAASPQAAPPVAGPTSVPTLPGSSFEVAPVPAPDQQAAPATPSSAAPTPAPSAAAPAAGIEVIPESAPETP